MPTLIADDAGVLRERRRETAVRVYEPLLDAAWLYELGIPVVETGDGYDVDIGQKVLLSVDRENVRPSYLRAVRVAVLNALHEWLEPERASDTWVREACADERTSPAAIRDTLVKRFGEGAVAYDPSDAESNKLSVVDGRQVVHGRSLSADEWHQARRAGALPPAGQVTPSPKPFHPDGAPLVLLKRDEWTAGIQRVFEYASWLGRELLERELIVIIANDPGWAFRAAYGDGVLYLNLARLGYKWFDAGASVDVNELLIHEFGHERCGDHLSSDYHRALTRLAAQGIALALEQPDQFRAAASHSSQPIY